MNFKYLFTLISLSLPLFGMEGAEHKNHEKLSKILKKYEQERCISEGGCIVIEDDFDNQRARDAIAKVAQRVQRRETLHSIGLRDFVFFSMGIATALLCYFVYDSYSLDGKKKPSQNNKKHEPII